ncbi:hypothetical protein ABMA27_010852 [Loxostege sticticalis]|uniref:Uncharacterized protein n=1 Tax=Loxostege sticticalis TaxID=481309 RepID=A0ABR3H2F9_LOXSC
MDLYTKLSQNMAELAEMFATQIQDHERRLQQHITQGMPPQTADGLSQEFQQFKALVWKSLGMLRSQLDLLTVGLDRHEMLTRRKVLLFHGVAENSNEDVKALVTGILGGQMEMPSEIASQIAVCHRLGAPKNSKSRPLLVRFTNYEARKEVWSHKTSLKGTGITVSEFLTKARHEVFMAGREHFGINNCWTMDGQITLLLPDNSRRRLECMRDLRILQEKFPKASTHQLPPKTVSSAGKVKSKPVKSQKASTTNVLTRNQQASTSKK